MFLFLIPSTIRQQSIIYPHIFSTDPIFLGGGKLGKWWGNDFLGEAVRKPIGILNR